MRFLADESCDFEVRALWAEGHDVSSVAEVAQGARDSVVLRPAREDARVLLSEDKDFGRLVCAAGQAVAARNGWKRILARGARARWARRSGPSDLRR